LILTIWFGVQVKRVEDVVYDLSLRGLLAKNSSETQRRKGDGEIASAQAEDMET
jgi:hypothetical protein